MQQLHLVGFTTDLEELIFSVRKGAKSGGYTVNLDEQLLTVIAEAVRMRRAIGADVSDAASAVEAAVRKGVGAGAAKAESALSPREVQARLRAGRSVKQVAKAAGVSEAWVERFAAPVRAEQAQVAARARALVFSKPRLGESAEPLGLSVRWNVAEKGVRFTEHEFDEHWSAYQFQDHVWIVRFTFESRKREQVAEWSLDLETGELDHRNRLASDLGYLEPGKRRKVADLVPDPAEIRDVGDDGGDDAEVARRATTTKKAAAARRKTAKPRTKIAKKAEKATAKKARTKKARTKKATTKKATTKATTRRATAKAGASTDAAARVAGTRAAAKKAGTKRTATKRTAAKRAGTRRVAAKKAGTKRTAARKKAPAARATKKAPVPPATTTRPTAVAASAPDRPWGGDGRPGVGQGGPWQSITGGTTTPTVRPLAPVKPTAVDGGEDDAERAVRRAARRARLASGPGGPSSGLGPNPTEREARPGQEPGARPGRVQAGHQTRGQAGRGGGQAQPRRTAEDADRSGGAGDAADGQPGAGGPGGQVVTIRANRATPPLAERNRPARPVAGDDEAQIEEGVLGEPGPLRPALQARAPRRRRYGNRT